MKPEEPDILPDLAIEAWRLSCWVSEQGTSGWSASPRRVVRRLEQLLASHGVRVIDPRGSAFNDGLAVEVVESEEGGGKPHIVETISPIVLRNEGVVRVGQVVIGPARASEAD